MGIEFEAKFLDINVADMRKLLLANGAERVHKKKIYKRYVFTKCDETIPGYSRVRKEGANTTMTIKTYKDPKFPEEHEITIKEDFNTGVNFFRALGLKEKAYQESIREKWSHPLAHEITFDTLPGLPTYMEIDCTSEDNLNQLIKLFNLDPTKQRFGAFDHTYLEYYGIERNIINQHTPMLTFANIQNEIKPTKNLELFQQMCAKHNIIANQIKEKKQNKTKTQYK
jgi:adenylate cyclase class 2